VKAAGALLLLPLALAGCDQMRVQPRYDAFARAALFADGQVNQTPPDGTVAREDAAWRAAAQTRPPMTPALLARGQARYRIACVQCHGEAGDGDGVVVSRGFPRPPAFTSAQVRALSSAQIVDVIAHGYGVMYPHADRVAPADRWAIAAYVQALQLSQAAVPNALPAADRRRLEAGDER
jgi:mono/diheme cytochrome c family protein